MKLQCEQEKNDTSTGKAIWDLDLIGKMWNLSSTLALELQF
jgi:hypothetical protein